MMVMSSTIFAVCGRSSLTHAPDLPWRANEYAEFTTGSNDWPIVCATRWPMRTESGICVPWYPNEVRLVVEGLEL